MAIAFSEINNRNPYIQDIIKSFKHCYKLGISIDNVLNEIPNLKEKHLHLMQEEKQKNTKTKYHYKNKFQKLIGKPALITKFSNSGKYIWNSDIIYETDDRKIIKILIKYFSVQKFFNEYNQTEIDINKEDDLFERLFPVNNKKEEQVKLLEDNQSNIKWLGKNKTEFVQLIYSLFHANLITNDTNEITEIVKDMAKFFKIDLSKNWQSNLSKSINNRNNDYVPAIFDNLKNSFANYSNKEL